jgi:hypothetical protein
MNGVFSADTGIAGASAQVRHRSFSERQRRFIVSVILRFYMDGRKDPNDHSSFVIYLDSNIRIICARAAGHG